MSKKALWTGRILMIFIVLFLGVDSIVHMLNLPVVHQASAPLGLPDSMAFPIGVIELLCVIFFVIPQTSVLGAILLTGYLGGAVAINFRAGAPLLSNTLFPVYTGIIVWLSLYAKDERIRALIPFRK